MYIIKEGCLCCHNCALECPVGAIDYKDTHYEINQDTCIGCGLCQQLCNVGAVVDTNAHGSITPHGQQELSCDLVVIGCGGSGSIAAVRAAEDSGKQVIVLEKAEKYGGSAWFAGFEVMSGGGPGGPGPAVPAKTVTGFKARSRRRFSRLRAQRPKPFLTGC